MGSGRALAPMRKINSETNLAVQLLLSVSDSQLRKQPSPRSTTSSDARADSGSDSDATNAATPSLSSPAARQDPEQAVSTVSPRTATLSRNDGTLFKYTREERQEALQRFREKKRRRQFQKRVRYMVRKRLAETRPRYKGRFSKPPPGENYDDGTPGPPAEKAKDGERKPVAVQE